MSTLVRVCSVDEVGPESAIPVEVPRNGSRLELAIVHSNGAFYAIADECSHASIPLSEGDVGDGEVECYLHGSRFDLRTGEPIGLPATEPVPIYRWTMPIDPSLIGRNVQEGTRKGSRAGVF